jgi:hypothetical protein
MSFYAGLASTAANVLRSFGTSLTLRRRGTGKYDAATGRPTLTIADETVIGVVEDFKAFEVDNINVQRGDKRITIAAKDLAPMAVGDAIIDGTVEYSIVSISTVAPAGVGLVYQVQVRR